MIPKRVHTAVASKTRMPERQSLWGLGAKAKQIVENVFNCFHREPVLDTTAAIQDHTADSTSYRSVLSTKPVLKLSLQEV